MQRLREASTLTASKRLGRGLTARRGMWRTVRQRRMGRLARGNLGHLLCWSCLTLNASPSLRTTSFQSQPRRTALWAVGTRIATKYFVGDLEILFRTPG